MGDSILERLFSLRNKAALVTGAGGGIGRALALALAEAGARLAVHDLDAQRLEPVARAITEGGGWVYPCVADLTRPESGETLIAEAGAALGRLDVLVNCAATNRRAPIEAVTLADYETIMAVNLRSVFFLSQAAHRIMRPQGGGKIIHIASINSLMGLGTVSVYGMTKAALAQVAKTMAVEWASDNVQVNCIAPGFMLTPLTEVPLFQDATKRRWILDRIPMRRPGQPEELIGVALLLASDASSYLTGQMIVVDGGLLAGGSWEAGG
jgi:NAD(P)-dependent dehydrogenase (short-subunit alcohol dehydrogenase family)